jgi:hypothetical protein
VFYCTLIFLNILIPSYLAWGPKIDFASTKAAAWVRFTVLTLNLVLSITTCVVLGISLLKINKLVSRTNFVSVNMAKLITHTGSFFLFICDSIIGLVYNFIAIEWEVVNPYD